ncbi:hypothetical protein [Streptomyces sp. SA15]|nr:hypothetical protein [Streptomyces sp. SA15]
MRIRSPSDLDLIRRSGAIGLVIKQMEYFANEWSTNGPPGNRG